MNRLFLMVAQFSAIGLLLSGCGGGGGSGGSKNPSQPAVSVSVLPSALNASGDASVSSHPTATLDLKLSSLPQDGVFVSRQIRHAGISDVQFDQTSDTSAVLTANFIDPAIIGPGVYDGSIVVAVCLDENCERHVAGSPQTISVKYQVTGVQAPVPSFVVPSKTIQAEGFSFANTAPSGVQLAYRFDDVGPAQSFSVNVTHTDNGVGGVHFLTQAATSGTFIVGFRPPAQLGAGVYKDTVTLNSTCYGCVRGVLNSQQTVNVEYTVGNTISGANGFSVNFAPVTANDLTWNAATQKIYVSVPSSASAYGNSVAVIDPATATIEASSFVGSEPGVLSASDDGQYLYVALPGASSVQRKKLSDLSQDILISLGNDPMAGALFANDVQVAPGQAQTIAVARRTSSNYSGTSAGVVIFDNATQRSSVAGGYAAYPALNWVQWATVNKLYANTSQNTSFAVAEVDVDSAGAHIAHTQDNVGNNFSFGRLHLVNGILYSDAGDAYEPSTRSVVGVFAPPNSTYSRAVIPDVALNKLFMLATGSNGIELRSFNLTTFTPISTANLYVSVPTYANVRLIRWGTDGLAFTTEDGRVALINGPFVGALAN